MLAHRESGDQQTSGRCIAGLRIGFGGGEEEEKERRGKDGWDDPHGPCKRKGSDSVVIVA